MFSRRRKKRQPETKWSWWKVLSVALFSLGIPGALLSYFPYYSHIALAFGAGLSLAGVVISLRFLYIKDWWGQITFLNIWFLLFLGIAIRAWTDVIPFFWFWLLLLLSLYFLAWALPVLHPKLSTFLLHEQLSPETIVGRGCLALAITLLPVAGGLGATFGIYGYRYGMNKLVSLIGAILGSITSLGLSQAMAHQMWPHRPWAKDKDEPQGEE